jgi:hypothetical protein
MSDISKSRMGENDAEFAARINQMTTFGEISAALHERAIQAGLVRPDNDPYLLHEVPESERGQFRQTVQDPHTGQQYEIVADSDLNLQRSIADFYRQRIGGTAGETRQTAQQSQEVPQPRNAQGQFMSQEDTARIEQEAVNEFERAQTQLQFQSGAITADEYLEKTGAIDKYLAKRGITPDALQQLGDRTYESKWEAATERFIERHPEWPGGEENMQLMVKMIQDSGYAERDDVSPDDVLEGAYISGLQHDLFEETAQQEHERLLSEAQTQQDIDYANHRYAQRSGMPTGGGSSLFER